MLRNNRVAVESKEQKLFNLIVSNYLLSVGDDCIEPFPVPEDLLPYAKDVNAHILVGTNYITYMPSLVFSLSDFAKLTALKSQISSIKQEIHRHKRLLAFKSDPEITAAHKTYMHRLHRYNEAKDTAQALLGKLAQITGRTTKDLYPDFDLSYDD